MVSLKPEASVQSALLKGGRSDSQPYPGALRVAPLVGRPDEVVPLRVPRG